MPLDRRKFLQAGGALAALGAVPPVIARALEIPAHDKTRSIQDVQHVVILMQENRSFDHYFGTMPGVRGFGDRFTIPLPEGRSVWQQSNGTRVVMPYHLDEKRGNAQRVNGTPHSWGNAQDAWDGGRMNEWPLHKRDHSMGYYTRAEVPFQFALADAFTVCDAYHCSLQGGTNPNRLFLWTGSNGASAAGSAAVVNEWDDFGPATEGYTWTTYPERLQRAGVSWKIYQNLPDNFTDNPLVGFRQYREAAFAALAQIPGATLTTPYGPEMEAVSPLLKGIANTMPDGGFLETLRADIANGTLPQVSWIIAPETYSEHPGPSSPIQGGWYMQAVLDALTANPEVWSKTVLIVNFDENDGFFDHVPPPAAPSLDATGIAAGATTMDVSNERFSHPAPAGTQGQPQPDARPYGMGPRVPMFVVSPWSRGGWVNSQVFDHTSVIRFLEQRFGVQEPNISAWRRAVAGDLTSALNFANPNDERAPHLDLITREAADSLRTQQEQLPQVAVPTEAAQHRPRQARGVRPSRALPYDIDVASQQDEERIALHFHNRGRAGAVLHVYDRLHLDRLPRRYTIEAGKSLADTWDTGSSAGAYDLWLLGPNGFHRHCAGNTRAQTGAARPELTLRQDAQHEALTLTFANHGESPCTFVIASPVYHGEHVELVQVAASAQVQRTRSLAREHGWYDLTVSVQEVEGFVRRVAGRVETGRHSVSDPAMGGRGQR